jgi:hypothetical protein
MITLMIGAIVLGLVAWIVTYMGIPEPFNKIIFVILCLILICLVLNAFGITNIGLR